MIRAMIFDLDGTLVQTERLKALSYARAARELSPVGLSESEVVEAYKDVVGLSRREVAVALLQRFGLEDAARARMAEFGVMTPWQAFVQLRLSLYDRMLADPAVLRASTRPHNMALLREARRLCEKVGLATMSDCAQARWVLDSLGLLDAFDFVGSADDIGPDLQLIKGGGGALLREKIVAQASRRVVIVADETKLSPALGTHWPVPVEVIPFGCSSQARYLESLGARVVPRKTDERTLFVTDQGNLILDCHFGPIPDPGRLADRLCGRAGIVAHGLFLGLATEVIVAGPGGLRHFRRQGAQDLAALRQSVQP